MLQDLSLYVITLLFIPYKLKLINMPSFTTLVYVRFYCILYYTFRPLDRHYIYIYIRTYINTQKL